MVSVSRIGDISNYILITAVGSIDGATLYPPPPFFNIYLIKSKCLISFMSSRRENDILLLLFFKDTSY